MKVREKMNERKEALRERVTNGDFMDGVVFGQKLELAGFIVGWSIGTFVKHLMKKREK